MKKAKFTALCLLLVSALLLSSCQLALDEQEYTRDKLVGISVKLGSSQRIIAENQRTGSRYEPHEVDGKMIRLNMYTDEDGVTFGGAEYDDSDWFEPVRLHVHSKDTGEEYTLETTIYAAEKMLPADPYLQIERVYEREDGSLYALAGGHNYSGSLDGIGLTISESWSKTDADGQTKTTATTIKLNVKYDEVVLSAEAVEMKGSGEEIARHKLTGQEELWISPETEWVLVEETLSDGRIRRTAVNGPLNNETFHIRKPVFPGVLIRETYKLRTSGALTGGQQPG